MALRNHNLPSERKKKRLVKSMKQFSKFPNTMRNHFLHPGHRKKRFGRSRLSDVLSRQMVVKLILCLLNVLKNDFGEVDEAMFEGIEGPFEPIFCILGIE
jgi:hypothetical protein